VLDLSTSKHDYILKATKCPKESEVCGTDDEK